MPTYEYKCEKCGEFEHEHSMSYTLSECPKCKGKVEKLISLSNFILIGGSWAKDNYK
jgi:putative FmdB family regulatory protein